LGDYNAKLADEGSDLIEMFRKNDLVGKRFYLTTFPLPKRRKKFEKWDVAENTFVKIEYEPTKKEKEEEDLKPGNNMQVSNMLSQNFDRYTLKLYFSLRAVASFICFDRWSQSNYSPITHSVHFMDWVRQLYCVGNGVLLVKKEISFG
jgi:hypothetical protein